MTNVLFRLKFAVLLCLLTNSALAAESATATNPCSEIAAPVTRLACYDKAFPPKVVGDTSAVEFGMTTPKKDTKAEPVKVDASITEVTMHYDGKRSITLDNGQVWKESETNPMVIVNKGMQVVVRDAAMGTFKLVIDGRVGLRVRRVK
jgi:hypothetical protein